MNTIDAPQGNTALAVDEIESLRQKSYNATVIRRIDITSDLARFQIRPDAGVPAFEPGQYVAVGMGYWESRVAETQEENLEPAKLRKMVRRAYSFLALWWTVKGTLPRAMSSTISSFISCLYAKRKNHRPSPLGYLSCKRVIA